MNTSSLPATHRIPLGLPLRLARWGIAALAGGLLSLAFPRSALSFPGQWGLELLAWVGLAPLLLLLWPAARGRLSLHEAFWVGWIHGLTFYSITLSWIIHTMVHYGGVPWILSVGILLLLAAYLALYFGAFAWVWTWIHRRVQLPWAFTAPPLWVSLEWLRGHLLTGFPWAALGYSQYPHLELIQVADLTGVYGVSFLILAVNAAVAEVLLWLRSRDPEFPGRWSLSLVWTLILMLATLLYGQARLHHPLPALEPLPVAVLQGNIPQELKWDPGKVDETLEIYASLSRRAVQDGARVLLWPETAVPFVFEEDPQRAQRIRHLAQDLQVFLLFGSLSLERTPEGIRPKNSAYLLSPAGEVLGRYDKIHLVPFGEYVPLSRLLFFVDRLVQGIGDFLPGHTYTRFPTPSGFVSVAICFEVIFPELVRELVREGIQWMVTITNDAWFGRTAAPYQHFSMVVFRAVENRIPFARAANTGISGFVDPWGRILEQTPLFERTYRMTLLAPRSGQSVYTRFGDWFPALCGGMVLGLVMLRLRRPHRWGRG